MFLYSELGALLASHWAIILMGDFSINVIKPTNPLSRYFNSSLGCLGFEQFLNVPAHNKDHFLDLVWCLGQYHETKIFSQFPISDHKIVLFDASVSLDKLNLQQTITFSENCWHTCFKWQTVHEQMNTCFIKRITFLMLKVSSVHWLSIPRMATWDLFTHIT